MSPAISILLPFYNAAPTLARCLDSLLAQSERDFEVLAVNDGSSDGGGEIATAYAARDGRIRLLSLLHGGIVAALNAGLEACRGRYIARMDADDLSLPQRLARQRAFLERHPRCDLVGALAEPIAEPIAELLAEPGAGRGASPPVPLSPGVVRYHRWMNGLLDDAAIKANLFVESPLPHPSFFARADWFRKLGGYRDPPWPEDYDLLLRAWAAGSVFGKVPAVLLQRTDGPDRLTRSDPRYRRDAMFRAKVHYFARGGWMLGRSGVVIGGSGTSGRKVAALLAEAGVPVRCFLDNKTGPPGRRVMGLPAFGYPEAIPAAFFAAHPGAFRRAPSREVPA